MVYIVDSKSKCKPYSTALNTKSASLGASLKKTYADVVEWYTRTIQNRLPQGLGVRVPPSVPLKIGLYSSFFLFSLFNKFSLNTYILNKILICIVM